MFRNISPLFEDKKILTKSMLESLRDYPRSLFGILHQYCSFYGAANPFSNSSIGEPGLCPIVGLEHLPLYLSGSGRASQETDISGSCQQGLLGIHNSVWV